MKAPFIANPAGWDELRATSGRGSAADEHQAERAVVQAAHVAVPDQRRHEQAHLQAAQERAPEPRRRPVEAQDAVASALGSFVGEFTLDGEAPLGDWAVRVVVDDRTFAGTFRVLEYRKPEFTVTVTPGKPSYKTGEEGKATVKLAYTFGGPVAVACAAGFTIAPGRGRVAGAVRWPNSPTASWRRQPGHLAAPPAP